MLIEFQSMSLNSKEYDTTELIIARDVLELSVLMCTINEDYSGFERDFLNLQRFYIDFYKVNLHYSNYLIDLTVAVIDNPLVRKPKYD